MVAPDFDSLVNQADYVVHATVTSVDAEWRTDGASRSIITKVGLTVSEVIKGNPPTPLILEVLGGQIGQTTMAVAGAPKFKVGDDEILFIHGNGQLFLPLVALTYGQYLVTHDSASGQDVVLRANGNPLYDVKDVGSPMAPADAGGSAVCSKAVSVELGHVNAAGEAEKSPLTSARATTTAAADGRAYGTPLRLA